MGLGIPFHVSEKASKPTIPRLMVRLVASSIDMALDEDVGLEGDSTYDDTFAIRQRELTWALPFG